MFQISGTATVKKYFFKKKHKILKRDFFYLLANHRISLKLLYFIAEEKYEIKFFLNFREGRRRKKDGQKFGSMYAIKTKNIGKIKHSKKEKNFWQLDDENFLCRFLGGDRYR